MIDKREVLGMILLIVIVGIITTLTTLTSRNEATIGDLRRAIDSQNMLIDDLIYQLNRCKTLHVETRGDGE